MLALPQFCKKETNELRSMLELPLLLLGTRNDLGAVDFVQKTRFEIISRKAMKVDYSFLINGQRGCL